MSDDRFVIFGLGNPGAPYARTRHNLGFMVVDALAEQYAIAPNKRQHHSYVGEGVIAGKKVILAKPHTYMNLSGQAAQSIVHFWRVPLSHFLVVCDDMDLEFGTLRLRPKGSAGGHNGLKSIIQALGSQEFPRLRIGIGRPPDDPIDHVLSPFTRQQWDDLPGIILRAADAVVAFLSDGIDAAMNKYNRPPHSQEER
ncbi:MAG: aminoacyl-tRNA hydrolase [Abditibacteriales bacterium]|nr:aminoacyl-tRNA hydrolase [Abditibacteriales bacterium]MDW8365718.1 aminoacyl-tRNA hydrolase [Abditibacteriales bacterium]